MSTEIFSYPIDQYRQDIDPVGHYIKQAALYISKVKNIPIETATKIISDAIVNKKGPFAFIRNPKVKYAGRKDNGDREIMKTTLNDYIYTFTHNRSIVAPTLTTYFRHDEKEVLTVKFVENNKKQRSVSKKKKFHYKTIGDIVKMRYYDNDQGNRKRQNNSFSGAYSSPYTILYFKTGHNTLTSATRMSTSNSNSLNEKLFTGNRHYFSKDIIINNIVFITSKIDKDMVQKTIAEFNLYIPTVDDVMNVIDRSAKLYCLIDYKEEVKKLVEKLDDLERAWFVYANDLYHLSIYNESMVRNMLSEVIEKKHQDYDYKAKDVYKYPEEYRMFAQIVCIDEVKGKGVDYDKMYEKGILKTLVPTLMHEYAVVGIYKNLFTTLFRSDVVPHNVADFPHSLRRCVMTSDTDSTIFSVQELVFWYLGREEFSNTGLAIQAFLVMLSTYMVSHILTTMSAQFNTIKSRLKDIYMKNEYTFPVYSLTGMAKHYFNTKSIQEGIIFDKPEREYKGVNLKSSNLPKIIKKTAHEMMDSIMDTIMNNKPIVLTDYLNKVREIENDIYESINSGRTDYVKVYEIKDKDSYKGDKFNAYQYYLLWQNVFAGKYPEVQTLPFLSMKLSLTTDSKKKLNDWLELKDPEFRTKFQAWLMSSKRYDLGLVMLPLEAVKEGGMPDEIKDIIDYRKIIKETCNIFYIILESIGFFIKDDYIVSDYFSKE